MNGFELLSRLDRAALRRSSPPHTTNMRSGLRGQLDRLPGQAYRARAIGARPQETRPAAARRRAGLAAEPHLPALLKELAASLRGPGRLPRRIASRVGERISFLDLDAVTHFVAQDKLTYAVVNGRRHSVDQSIAELERRLDPVQFLRVHRSAAGECGLDSRGNSWFAGKVSSPSKMPSARRFPSPAIASAT